MNEQTLLLKADEAAKLLSLGRSKVFLMVATGELPSVRVGRAVRIPRAELEEWVRRQVHDGSMGSRDEAAADRAA
jgi:excisionase family DNA binding protein